MAEPEPDTTEPGFNSDPVAMIYDLVSYLPFSARPMTSFEKEPPAPTNYRGCPGEQRLALAILEDAVQAYRKGEGKTNQSRRLYNDARTWLLTDEESEWVFSFINICERLGFSPAYIRKGVFGERQEDDATRISA